MRRLPLLAVVVLAMVPVVAKADSVNTVAQELKASCNVPFRYGVAQDLASNLLAAQASAWYAGPVSLELSIESVLRAIGIDGMTYVGFADVCPITWLQSRVAIDPDASVGITPSAIYFGEVAVATPEPRLLVLVIAGIGLFVMRRLK